MRKTDRQAMKDSNLSLIFRLICEKEIISRAELKNITKLSAATVSYLTDELIEKGYVYEVGAGEKKTSGRKPILLRVNKTGGCFASVEILSSEMIAAFYDLELNQIAYEKKRLQNVGGLGTEVSAFVKECVRKHEIYFKLLAVSLGISGIIDRATGEVVSSTTLELDGEDTLLREVKNAFPGLPVHLQDDSSLVAYAQKEFSEFSGSGTLISVDIGEGVGAGIIVDGKIFEGANGMAGEFGHISVDCNGALCKCGGRGCLETMVSIPAILGRMKEKEGLKQLSWKEAVEGVKSGNSLGLEVVREAARRLAYGLNNLINLIDPQAIIISGEITALEDAFMQPLTQTLNQMVLLADKRSLQVQYSKITGNAVTLGGARYALDSLIGGEG